MNSATPALSRYRSTARSLAAKSALPLAGAAATLLAPALKADVHVVVPTSGNVADLNSAHHSIWVDFFNPTNKVGYATNNNSGGTFTIFTENRGIYGGIVTGLFFPPRSGNYFGRFSDAYQTNNGFGYPDKLSGGVTIDSTTFYRADSGPYFNHPYLDAAQVWQGGTGYVAVKFYNDSQTNTYYGWLKLQTNSDASQITLLALGYNDTPGASITTPVPEPAVSSALLALGAAGLVAYRKRKNLQRATA